MPQQQKWIQKMNYKTQTVEEILVLARHGVLQKTPENANIVDALGEDILGSLDDDDLYQTFLDHVRDTRQERKGIREIEVAIMLRAADDEAQQVGDEMALLAASGHP